MRINRYFFKKHIHTLRRKLFDVLRRAQRSFFVFLGRLSDIDNIRLWLRKNTAVLLKRGQQFFGALYERLILRAEYTKRDFIVLFIVAFSLGVALKSAAAETITIGFDDYTLPPKETLLDLNAVQKKMIEKGGAFLDNNGAQGGVCSE